MSAATSTSTSTASTDTTTTTTTPHPIPLPPLPPPGELVVLTSCKTSLSLLACVLQEGGCKGSLRDTDQSEERGVSELVPMESTSESRLSSLNREQVSTREREKTHVASTLHTCCLHVARLVTHKLPTHYPKDFSTLPTCFSSKVTHMLPVHYTHNLHIGGDGGGGGEG